MDLLTAPWRVDEDEDVLALVFDDGVVVLARQDLQQGGSIDEGENGETDEGIVRCGQKEISGEREADTGANFQRKPHSAPRHVCVHVRPLRARLKGGPQVA